MFFVTIPNKCKNPKKNIIFIFFIIENFLFQFIIQKIENIINKINKFNNNNNMETYTEPEFIGIMLLGELFSRRASLLEKDLDFDYENEIINLYKEASIINEKYTPELAIYYEDHNFPFNIVENEYLKAISKFKNSSNLFNLADFYKKNKKYPEMIKYLITNINDYEDCESMVFLALYYSDINNNETAIMYYKMALFNYDPDDTENGVELNTFITIKELIKLFDIIDENNLCKDNDIYRNLKKLYNETKHISIYNNKVRLFTQLNHFTECGICLNTELNIDLNCGHCVCKKCYLELFESPCPFCRR
uniref:RING-type domain-containing protein n=1 Tax=viral metagenome TaxID=1070528 RepID=A0A6C0HUK2_9ZZZZ